MFIRADASIEMGTGHIMRCLTVAEMWRDSGIQCQFITRALPGDLNHFITQQGFTVISLAGLDASAGWEEDADQTLAILAPYAPVDWILVDHYNLDLAWELKIKPFVNKLVVIDDWAHRRHACDLLINANIYDEAAAHTQRANVPPGCLTLLGPSHALLRREFRETAKIPRNRDGSIRRILVSFGGSDHTNQTSKVLRAFKQPGFSSIQIDVVIGRANPYQAEIQSLCAGLPQVQVHLHSDDMASLMQKADLCIGAVGTTSWERCYLGLPALCLTVAHNQSDAAAFLHQAGAVIHLGWFENVTEDDIARSVRHVMEQPSIAADMSVKARRIMKDYDRHAAMLIPAWLSNNKAVNTDE